MLHSDMWKLCAACSSEGHMAPRYQISTKSLSYYERFNASFCPF